ncbi:MAG: ubiquinone-dependent pyruvate dehydrogenase [Chloroflexi bacterium]|nr:ubiquinone-dependent pyruvate dehydrogenase [Chloroflexota bacterium]
MAYTVSDLIIETLQRAGVRRVYGIPGDSLNGFTDALHHARTIAWQHVRHEEAAAFAAAGDAAITGELAVCAASCGPGNLHLINGLYDAHRSRVPVLVVAAHIPSKEIGGNYFQETHPQELFRECSTYCELVSSAKQLPYALNIALRTAVEQKDVAVLVIPGDVLLDSVERPALIPSIRTTSPVVRPSDSELATAADVLNSANHVTVLGGAGCSDARPEVLALADVLQAPIVHAMRGKQFLEYDNPFDVGMTGLLGFRSGYLAMEQCDALLMLGTDFPYREFYPRHARVIQVDLRGDQIGRRVEVDVPLVGTVKDTIAAILPRLKAKHRDGHLDRMRAHYVQTRKQLDELAFNDHNRSPLHPQFVARMVDEIAAEDAVFVADVGTPVIWAARYLRMNGKRHLIGSFSHGSMANAVPQAVGIQSAQPGRQVVTLSGDGGLAMLFGELITLRQLKLPVKIVVFNNASLSFVELEMKASGFTNFGTDLENPNFSEVAAALGLHSQRVDHPDDLADGLRRAFAYDGPALVEVMTARQELSIPPTITLEQVKGFSVYATRAILSGRGDELIDLAETNVLRHVEGLVVGSRASNSSAN